MKSHVLGGVVGAIAMAAIVAGLWLAGYTPSRQNAATPGAPAANSASTDAIAARLDKIQGALQERQSDPAIASRTAAAEAETKSLGDSIAALTRRVDDVAAASQSALAESKTATTAADAAKNAAESGVQRSDVEALANRLAALETAVKALADNVARRPASADDRTARLTVAAEALRAMIERGAPYPAELAAAKALGADQNLTAQLEPFAAAGVPGAALLAHQLAMLTPALLRTADAEPVENSLLGRLKASARTLVRVTPAEAPAGDEPSAVIARLNADAARADISAALADIVRLPESARAPAADWIKQAEARNAAIAASRRIAADALAALSKPAPQ